MKTAQQIFDETMVKAKNMREFVVTQHVNEGWFPQGRVPFDMHVKGNTATITVYAVTAEEANQLVADYMETQ